MCRRKAILLIACSIVCVLVSAQQYPYVHYTPRDGLVNSRVRNAYQDSKGRMYFATYGGLSVFDGARFINYTTQNGLLADLVNDVLEVGEDSLLVATNDCGLNVLVRGQMKQLEIVTDRCLVVNRLVKGNDGCVYATTDQGLYRIRQKKFEKLSMSLPGSNIPLILLGPLMVYRDYLVFFTYDANKNDLFVYNKRTGVITDHRENKDTGFYSIQLDRAGIPWLGTAGGTFQLDTLALAGGKLKMLQPQLLPFNAAPLPGGIIHFNNKNELLISMANNQILRYRLNGVVQQILFPDKSTRIQNFFIDGEDVIWVCHDGNGIFKLSGTKFQSEFPSPGNNRSGIRTIGGITSHDWWILMNNGGLIQQMPGSSRAFGITPSFIPYSISTGKKYIYAADFRTLYMTRAPAATDRVLHFKKIMNLPDSANFGGLSITDKNGNSILFETRNLLVLDGNRLVYTYPLLTSDLVQGMHLDKDNRLWVISRYNGLLLFSLHPETPGAYLRKELHFVEEFESGSPRSMVIDGTGLLWAGTRYKGLMCFRLEKNRLKKIRHYQTKEGLTDNFVTALACDRNDNIIIGTQTGLDRLVRKKEGYQLENITKTNNSFTYISDVWTDSTNTAFAWTHGGDILRIEPAISEDPLFDPQLLIEEIKINGKAMVGLPAKLRLTYQQRNITFSVAAPSFIDEKQVKYSYLLSGRSNKDWSEPSSTADITFLELVPGNYTLHVRAYFPSTAYPSKETSFSFSMLPPWWQSWWFRLGTGLLVLGLLIFGFRFYYTRKLERQKVVLEKQQAVERERTRIATDMHDDLGAGLSKIRFLSETVQRNIHEAAHQPTLKNIASSSVELVDKFNEIIWAMNEKNNSLEDLVYYIRNYTAKYCEENNLAYLISLPEQIPFLTISGELRRHIFLTIKECLHNVVKHAGARNINLVVELDRAICIQIQDDGKGFDLAEMRNAGNGLRNMEQRIRQVNGELVIESWEGTHIKMKVPIPAS